jgi:hypothetical protein
MIPKAIEWFILKQSLIKPHDPIAVMPDLIRASAFWISCSSLPAFGGARGDQGQRMMKMRLYYIRS